MICNLMQEKRVHAPHPMMNGVDVNPVDHCPGLTMLELADLIKKEQNKFVDNELETTFRNKRKFVTKDSGERQEYPSGMVRDTDKGKPRFDLMFPKGIPYEEQFLYRVGMLLARGVEKYGERNWELAAGEEEFDRFGGSQLRHSIQDYCGEIDEDHAAATFFNILARQSLKWKMENGNGSDVQG